ncbi:MAG: hypothetical protein KBC69_03800 [Candidatus Magasanikbacteria bacterium]|nr:hypothetical protein [Candidatus Magasanikbacteria bacterium]
MGRWGREMGGIACTELVACGCSPPPQSSGWRFAGTYTLGRSALSSSGRAMGSEPRRL